MAIGMFPSQKRSTASKGKQFYKDCIDAGIEMIDSDLNSGLRASMKEKITNNNLANNILDPKDVESVINPWRVKGYDFPLEMRNYPILKSSIDLIVGEEIKRRFEWRVMLRNSEAISDKERMTKDRYFQFFTEVLKGKSISEEDFKRRLKELDRWKSYEAKDIRERMANEILTYQYDNQKMAYKFNAGMENALILGEEIYSVDFVAGDVVFDRVNPLTFYTIRGADTPFIEQADMFIVDSYLPLNVIIDRFSDYLTDADVKKIEAAFHDETDYRKGVFGPNVVPQNYMKEAYDQDVEIIPFGSINNSSFSGSFDDSGNGRVVRVVWTSLRKVGKLRYIDEEGDEQFTLVDENHKPDEDLGQTVEWLWVKEYLQGFRILDDIYVAYEPFPRIGTSIINPSICIPPFVGTCYTIGDNTAMSTMSYGRPYQYLFNATMNRIEHLVITSHGSVAPLPLHLIPDGWEMDDWMYYFSFLNFYVYDAFKEGNKGLATGKLAGNMMHIGGDMRFDNASQIQQNMAMLALIKSQIDEITGITPQRKGQIETRESVGGVERSVSQSSTITEKWFYIHEDTKIRALTLVLEATKYAWRKLKTKRQLVLSDGSEMMIDFDGEAVNSAEYGLFASSSSKDNELFNVLKDLSKIALQAKIIKMSDIISIFSTNSASQVRMQIKDSEIALEEQQRQAYEQQKEEALKQLEENRLSEDKMLALDKYIAELQEETKRMKIASDKAANLSPEDYEKEKLALEEMKVLIQERLDKARLELERMMHKDNIRIKEREIEVKDKQASRKPSISK